MPLYQYRCKQCGNQFSKKQKFSDDPLTDCPVCEGEIRRVINSVGIVFKGSGFYVTDNKNGSKRNSGTSSNDSKESSSETASESKSETKSDAKSDSKSESKKETKKSSTN